MLDSLLILKLLEVKNVRLLELALPIFHSKMVVSFDLEVANSEKPFDNVFRLTFFTDNYKLLLRFYYVGEPVGDSSFTGKPISIFN